ncbi:hypothetical protein B1218_36915, partial [Pseudomonas ogarae]
EEQDRQGAEEGKRARWGGAEDAGEERIGRGARGGESEASVDAGREEGEGVGAEEGGARGGGRVGTGA